MNKFLNNILSKDYKKGKLIDNIGKFNYSIVLNKGFRFNNDGFYKTYKKRFKALGK